MKLDELKKLIAEEYTAFKQSQRKRFKLKEQGPMPTVNVSDMDVDAEGGENAEDTLKSIYDMLKDYFEGGDDAADDAADDVDVDDKDDDMDDMEEGKDDEDKKDLNEGGCYGEDGKPMPESHCYEEDGNLKEGVSKSSKILQERFKKLANIIK